MESPEIPVENGHDHMSLTHSNSPHSDPGTHEQESLAGSTTQHAATLRRSLGQIDDQPMGLLQERGRQAKACLCLR